MKCTFIDKVLLLHVVNLFKQIQFVYCVCRFGDVRSKAMQETSKNIKLETKCTGNVPEALTVLIQ